MNNLNFQDYQTHFDKDVEMFTKVVDGRYDLSTALAKNKVMQNNILMQGKLLSYQSRPKNVTIEFFEKH